MWEKIVLNLISNAFKFTFEGTIAVSLRNAGDNVELRVRDTGVGIPEEELPRLFDRFHRIENSRSRTHEGSGIGLALVQELAKLHGGFVRIESVLGQGSTFLVSLPKGKAHLSADKIGATRTLASTAVGATPYVEEALRWLPDAGQSQATDEIPTIPELLLPVPYVPRPLADNESESRARILVVDDNADMRQYLVRLLAERYEVQAVPDGEAALEAVRERRPDLVLTDVMMPNLDGFGLLRELRSDAATRTIPIILLSARAGEEARVEGIERGADDYLIKPFSAREMLARVQTHLELSRVRKQSEERERQMAAEALAASAKFRAVFDETPVFAGIMTVDGVVVDANRLCLDACGYRAEEVVGLHFWNTGWWRGSQEVQEKIQNATKQAALGVPYRENLPYHWADGTERLVDFGLHPIRDHQGEIIFLHPTGIDITDLKRAEQNYQILVETLDAEVQARTRELESRNVEVIRQSELLRELSRRLMQAQDDERRHVARELHDSAGQTLTALGMNLASLAQQARKISPELAQEAEEGKQLVLELSQEIRTMSYLLHPPLLDESGIGDALHWYIRGLEERSGLNISLVIPEELGRFSHELELSVFRIVQECLTNVHRHSGSKVATICIARDQQGISLEVRDEGKGISPEKLVQLQAKGGGVGIRGMRERVLQLGGEMRLNSEDTGTSIAIILPFAKNTQSEAVDLQASSAFE